MVQALMMAMAVCALLGGLDRILGNRFGLGKPFEDGFQMLGPVGLSMAGIICFAPVLSSMLGRLVIPFYHLIGQDPAMFGSILAIDMGGYQMALSLGDDPQVARFAGIVAASILGCTMSFTIPMGMGMYQGETRANFARGILYGLGAMPVALVLGALLCGLPFLSALWLCLPVILLAALLMLALHKAPDATLKAFSGFAWLLRLLTTVGLAVGAFQYMSGIVLLPELLPLEEAMKTVSAICIVMLGSLPLAEILQRLLRRPFNWLGERIGIGGNGVTGLLLFYLNATPGLVALPQMSARGQVVNAAFAVCSASCLTAHFAFTMNYEPQLATVVLVTKLAGAVLAAVLALGMTRRK